MPIPLDPNAPYKPSKLHDTAPHSTRNERIEEVLVKKLQNLWSFFDMPLQKTRAPRIGPNAIPRNVDCLQEKRQNLMTLN